MKTHTRIYKEIISFENLTLAWRNARKGKTGKGYVIEFEQNLFYNLMALHYELKYRTYQPKPLVTFILRDPKTRVISKSDFRDRIVHHAIVNILEPIFDKGFIYDSCANRTEKGNLFALKRFDYFKRKISKNGLIVKNKFKDNNYVSGYCLKADIKHYFQEVDCDILIKIISRKIEDSKAIELIQKILNNNAGFRGGGRSKNNVQGYVLKADIKKYFDNVNHAILINIISHKVNDDKLIWLTKKVLENFIGKNEGTGMPLGNYTSQFFANVYLNELDYFVKHDLRAKYYIRYVDDFIILHKSQKQLLEWKAKIDNFLENELKIKLHPQKSRIITLRRGVDFVGFRNFYKNRLLRKRNVKSMFRKIRAYKNGKMSFERMFEIYKGWEAYAKWSDSYKLRNKAKMEIIDILWNKL